VEIIKQNSSDIFFIIIVDEMLIFENIVLLYQSRPLKSL
jgi:hypothetical protein